MKDYKVVTMVDTYHTDLEISSTDGTFTLIFYGSTPGEKRLRFRIELRHWFVRYIAKSLWRVIAHQRKEVAESEQGMLE